MEGRRSGLLKICTFKEAIKLSHSPTKEKLRNTGSKGGVCNAFWQSSFMAGFPLKIEYLLSFFFNQTKYLEILS